MSKGDSKGFSAREIRRNAKECVGEGLRIAKNVNQGSPVDDESFATLLFANDIMGEQETIRAENANMLIIGVICLYTIALFATGSCDWLFIAMMCALAAIEVAYALLSYRAAQARRVLFDAQQALLECEAVRSSGDSATIIDFPNQGTTHQKSSV